MQQAPRLDSKPHRKPIMTPHATSTNASVGTILGLAGKAVEGAETLAALNLQTLKTLMAESQENSRIASTTRDPAELIKLQAAALQAAPLKALAYGRQVQEVFASFGAARRVAYKDGIAGAQAKFLEAVSTFFNNAPGSERIVALAQSAVDASNKAYEGMNTASKQLSDTLAANTTKVGETVAQGSSNASAKIEV
ncbi:TIGR01841 family phasin [Variovorax sp. J22R115]|uniref:TIGR01841 family phasin n=1 Tax=Variovorax sp. J22R115 TaxID=3053509 RepID=UPI0025767248|nr:TIGR01841 family phasin [Variovorax sp. J22R115]MDM0050430.1 TIGR01841 family phasin [Variovorax sp. J22R115]